jgi:hypothetical protein
MRTPGSGIQPQVAVDRKGVLHLIYFSGDPSAGDVYYVRKAPGAPEFSQPVRVQCAEQCHCRWQRARPPPSRRHGRVRSCGMDGCAPYGFGENRADALHTAQRYGHSL